MRHERNCNRNAMHNKPVAAENWLPVEYPQFANKHMISGNAPPSDIAGILFNYTFHVSADLLNHQRSHDPSSPSRANQSQKRTNKALTSRMRTTGAE